VGSCIQSSWSGVAVGPTSPPGVVRLLSVSSTSLVAAYGLTALFLDLGPSRRPVLEDFPCPSCSACVSERGAPPLSSFHSPSGFHRRPPAASRAFTRVRLRPMPFLSWDFGPYSGLELEGSGQPGGSRRRHLASSGFVPLDALLPFEPSRSRFRPGAAPGIPTFRAFSLPEIRRSFELTRALLSVAPPDRRTLAVPSTGPGVVRG
jgi:hypothetical protein